MNDINPAGIYKNVEQLPREKINTLVQNLHTQRTKLEKDFRTAQRQLPTLEKEYFEVKILFKIGAITSIDYAKFEYQLKNAREIVSHYVELMNAANAINSSLGKLNPATGTKTNYLKSDAERAREKQPRAPLSISREGAEAERNRIENGGCYSPAPDLPLLGEA